MKANYKVRKSRGRFSTRLIVPFSRHLVSSPTSAEQCTDKGILSSPLMATQS